MAFDILRCPSRKVHRSYQSRFHIEILEGHSFEFLFVNSSQTTKVEERNVASFEAFTSLAVVEFAELQI